ncbi:MAG: hypothetical protein L6V93_14410 [Clostridiales bacterium]|nr:MAG: hypothetical protein L6V93_14410 [Clostridiales bacterium]
MKKYSLWFWRSLWFYRLRRAAAKQKNTGTNDENASGGNYSDLMTIDGLDLAVEEYGIGFRSGSDVVDEVNKIMKKNSTTTERLKRLRRNMTLQTTFWSLRMFPQRQAVSLTLTTLKRTVK